MSKPRTIKFATAPRLVTHGLARNLYPTWLAAMMELVFNGIDSATRRGVEPEIVVQFMAANEHPLSKVGPAVMVLDNGTGFTTEVVDAYNQLGQSVSLGRTDIHGKHGVGKVAPFALGEDVDHFYILTRTQKDDAVWKYRINASEIFGGGFEPEEVTQPSRLQLPPTNVIPTFGAILVPNIEPQDADDIRAQLTHLLPLRPLKVFVDFKQVEARRFAAQTTAETPPIKMFGGVVKMQFARAEVSTANDTVELFDTNGRPIAELMSAATRQQLHPVFRDPRLIGMVFVPGLEQHSASHRAGLGASFWKSAKGKKLLEVVNAFGAPKARDVLGPEDEGVSSNPIQRSLSSVAEALTTCFGLPEDPILDNPDDKTATEDGGDGPAGGGGNGGSGGGGGSGNPGNPRPPRPNTPGSKAKALLMRIEDTDYRVMSFPTTSTVPVEVRQGKVLVINTAHAAVTNFLSAPVQLRSLLLRAMVDAHVARTRRDVTEQFGMSWTLWTHAMSAMKK